MKYIWVIYLCCFLPLPGVSQQWEGGILFGATNFLGEMGGQEGTGRPYWYDLQPSLTKEGLGLFARYQKSKRLSHRFNFIYGQIAGDDRLTDNLARRLRNVHFQSKLFELSYIAEIAVFNINIYRSKAPRYSVIGIPKRITNVFSMFGFAGVGGFYFNPKAEYLGVWYKLRDCCTEGQTIYAGKKKYSLFQMSIPMGVGFAYYLPEERFKVGIELGWRKTFTDYLDDVSTDYADPEDINNKYGSMCAALSNRSWELTNPPLDRVYTAPGQQRGDPYDYDSYIFTLFSFTYIIKESGKPFRPKYEPIR